jgi:hypothetical protein
MATKLEQSVPEGGGHAKVPTGVRRVAIRVADPAVISPRAHLDA